MLILQANNIKFILKIYITLNYTIFSQLNLLQIKFKN